MLLKSCMHLSWATLLWHNDDFFYLQELSWYLDYDKQKGDILCPKLWERCLQTCMYSLKHVWILNQLMYVYFSRTVYLMKEGRPLMGPVYRCKVMLETVLKIGVVDVE